jgi:outer membrane protein assembly factor BamB
MVLHGDPVLCRSPVVAGAGGQVFIASEADKLYELDEATGAVKSTSKVSSPSCFIESSSMSPARITCSFPGRSN